jgi:hypothetical protein
MGNGNQHKAEIIRWWFALGGVILWFLYFAAQFAFMHTDMRAYCAPREAAGELCGYDYIPVAELIFVPACLLLFGYPFARLPSESSLRPSHGICVGVLPARSMPRRPTRFCRSSRLGFVLVNLQAVRPSAGIYFVFRHPLLGGVDRVVRRGDRGQPG